MAANKASASPPRSSNIDNVRARTRQRLNVSPPARSRIQRKLMASSYSFGGKDWKKLFLHYDSNNDGSIMWLEFRSLIRNDAKISKAALSDADLRGLFKLFDKNGDGNLKYSQFIDWVQPSAATHSPPTSIDLSKAPTTRDVPSTRRKRWNSILVSQLKEPDQREQSNGQARSHSNKSQLNTSSPRRSSVSMLGSATPKNRPNATMSSPRKLEGQDFVPGLNWIRLSRCLHLELVEENYAGAQEYEIDSMLNVIEAVSTGHVTMSEFSKRVASWGLQGRQRAAKQRHDTTFRKDLMNNSRFREHQMVTRSPTVQVPVGDFREILLRRCLGESDLALMCALLVQESNRTLLSCNLNSNITPQWLCLAQKIFFALDTAGHGILTFLEVRALALALTLYQDFRSRQNAGVETECWNGGYTRLSESVSRTALSLMGSFGVSERGMISLRRFRALLVVRGETIESLSALERVLEGNIEQWKQASFEFALPRRLWDTAVREGKWGDDDNDELTTFLLSEGPRLMWDSEREDKDFNENLSTNEESQASRFAAELWKGFLTQRDSNSGKITVSIDSLMRDTRASIVFECVGKFFQIRSRMLEAMSSAPDVSAFLKWSEINDQTKVALLDTKDPVHTSDIDDVDTGIRSEAKVGAVSSEKEGKARSPAEMQRSHLEIEHLQSKLSVEIDESVDLASSSWSPSRLQIPDAAVVSTLEESSVSLDSLFAPSHYLSARNSSNMSEPNKDHVIKAKDAEIVEAPAKIESNRANFKTSRHSSPIDFKKTLTGNLQNTGKMEAGMNNGESDRPNMAMIRRRSTHLDMIDAAMSASGITLKQGLEVSDKGRNDGKISSVETTNPEAALQPDHDDLLKSGRKQLDHEVSPRIYRSKPKSHPNQTNNKNLSRYLEEIFSALPAPDDHGARVICSGTVLKKGSANEGVLGRRNWKQRDFVASLYLPNLSSILNPNGRITQGRKMQKLAFSPHIRLSYFAEGKSAHTPPLGQVFLDGFSLILEDHDSPTKTEKYKFCFSVSRPVVDGSGKKIPEMDLSSVLPHDKNGRPLALASGFAGIRHNILLRAMSESDYYRWQQVLTKYIKICHLIDSTQYRPASRKGSPSPAGDNPSAVSHSAPHIDERQVSQGRPRKSETSKKTVSTTSNMLSRSLANSILDWESEMAIAREASGHPSESLELPPTSISDDKGIWDTPTTTIGAAYSTSEDYVEDAASLFPTSESVSSGANDNLESSKESSATSHVKPPTRNIPDSIELLAARRKSGSRRAPELVFGERASVPGNRNSYQKSIYGTSLFDKRLEELNTDVKKATRILTKAEQEALYKRLSSPESSNSSPWMVKHAVLNLADFERANFKGKSTTPMPRKRWNSILVKGVAGAQQIQQSERSDLMFRPENKDMESSDIAVDRTIEILTRDASANGITLEPKLIDTLKALKSDDAPKVANVSDKFSYEDHTDVNDVGSASPTSNLLISKRLSNIPHGEVPLPRAYERPAFT